MNNYLTRIFFVVFANLLWVCPSAWADQCAYISKKLAIAAVSQLSLEDDIYLYCEPCEDKSPKPVKITSLAAKTTGYKNYWQVEVNQKGIDLAYTFIEIDANNDNNQWLNLAIAVGCPVEGVSPVLSIIRP